MDTSEFYGKEKISRILLKIAPPVMLAQLIQALYNIVDSLFVGKYSETGLTALSIIYPLQLLMIALAVGTGVGINTDMAYYFGIRQEKKAEEVAGIGTPLAVFLWIVFAAVCYLIMPFYARISTNSEEIIRDVVIYGRIVCVVSIGLFTEGVWSKILQARGDMKTPMVAQIAGAITNIILDPILIFGMFGIHKFGIAGAAIATVIGQIVAALVVMRKAFVRSPEKSCYLPHIKRIYQLDTEHSHAVCVHVLYFRAEYDPCRIFGSGGDGTWAVLQMAEFFLYSTRSIADLHRTGHQLQLCGKRSGEMQSRAERIPDRGNGSDVSWNAVF